METLILVKHSLPELNPSAPANKWPLSSEGRTRALALGACLAAYRPGAIFTSPEPKASETAQVVGRRLGLGVTALEGLHEHERGSIGWVSRKALQSGVADFFRFPDRRVFGDESADEAHARFSAAVERASLAREAGTAMVVAHGTVIALFVSRLAQVAPFPLWQRLGLPSFVVLAPEERRVVRVVGRIGAERTNRDPSPTRRRTRGD